MVTLILFQKGIVAKKDRVLFSAGLSIKIMGAIALGLVYQFYYDGGDTFNYWEFGSSYIYEAFLNNPWNGLKMIFGDIRAPEHFSYFSRIMLNRGDDTLLVIRIAAFIDLFTGHTYSSTAIIFSLFSFLGSWYFFITIRNVLFTAKNELLFLSIFCFPSVIIWGSGLMKDTLALGGLLILFSIVINWLENKRTSLFRVLIFVIIFWMIAVLRMYIVLIFVPIVCIWIFLKFQEQIKSFFLKASLVPVLFAFTVVAAFLLADNITESSSRYSLSAIPKWSAITANDLGYWTGKNAGSGYSLGYRQETWGNMFSKFLPAVNVTLFRPYPWEVSSFLMLLASLESMITLFLAIFIVLFRRKYILSVFSQPILISCLGFILIFAFAVGVSSYNFGSLVRYKIPVFPFLGMIFVYLISGTRGTEARD